MKEAKDDSDAGAVYLGPVSRRVADDVVEVMQLAVSLRTCAERLTTRSRRNPCGLHALGRCAAPCLGGEAVDDYQTAVADARTVLTSDTARATEAVMSKISALSSGQRYEEAAAWLNRLKTFLRVLDRTQQRQALADLGEVVAAEPVDGGWHIHVIRYGRLAGAAVSEPGSDARSVMTALLATADHVERPAGPGTASLAEEADLILSWLDSTDVRVIAMERPWAYPIGSAARDRHALTTDASGVSRRHADPTLEDVARPA